MVQESEFTTFAALIKIGSATTQNVQEVASIWGDIKQDFDDTDADIEESYAVLGEFDFLVIFEGPSSEAAFQADVVFDRYGLEVQTMELTETSAFADLVTDI